MDRAALDAALGKRTLLERRRKVFQDQWRTDVNLHVPAVHLPNEPRPQHVHNLGPLGPGVPSDPVSYYGTKPYNPSPGAQNQLREKVLKQEYDGVRVWGGDGSGGPVVEHVFTQSEVGYLLFVLDRGYAEGYLKHKIVKKKKVDVARQKQGGGEGELLHADLDMFHGSVVNVDFETAKDIAKQEAEAEALRLEAEGDEDAAAAARHKAENMAEGDVYFPESSELSSSSASTSLSLSFSFRTPVPNDIGGAENYEVATEESRGATIARLSNDEDVDDDLALTSSPSVGG